MPFKIQQTRVAANTAVANQDITISGFGTPKAAIFIMGRGLIDSTLASHSMLSIGATDGTRNRTFGITCQNGVSPSQTAKRGMSDQCIFASNTAGTIDGEAVFSTWITDGVRINWGDLPSAAFLFDTILFGGDIQVVASSIALNGTSGNTTAIDIGFKPDSIFVFGSTALADANSATAIISIGFADNYSGTFSQGCISYLNQDNLVAVNVRGMISNDCIMFNNGGDSGKHTITSFDSTGFTTRCDIAGAATISFLAIKYNSKTRHKMSDFFGPTSLGNFNVDDIGFKPKCVFNIFDLRTSFNIQTSGTDAGSIDISCITDPSVSNNFLIISNPLASGGTGENSQSDATPMFIYDYNGNIAGASSPVLNASGYSMDVFDTTAVAGGASLYLAIGSEYEERVCDFFIKGHKEAIYSSSDLYITFENNGSNDPIKVSNLDGGNLIPVSSIIPLVEGSPGDIQIDNINDKIYWIEDPGDSPVIKRSDLDGLNYEIINSGSLNAMKIDVPDNHIFGIDFSPYSIKRLDLNGSNETVVYSGAKAIEPNSIDIDRVNQKIYWTDQNVLHEEISTIDYNGSGVQDIVNYSADFVGIAIDVENQKVYWGIIDTPSSPTMFRANVDGSDPETIIPSGFDSLRSLVVDYAFQRVYAIDVSSREVIRVSIDDNDVEILPFGFIDDGSENPVSLTIDQRFYKYLYTRGSEFVSDSSDFFIHGHAFIDNVSGILQEENVLFYHALDDATEFVNQIDWINNSSSFVNGLISSGIQHSGTAIISRLYSPVNNDYTDLGGMTSATALIWSSGFWNHTGQTSVIELGFGDANADPTNSIGIRAGSLTKQFVSDLRDSDGSKTLSVFPTNSGWNIAIIDFRHEGAGSWRYRISFSGSDWIDLGVNVFNDPSTITSFNSNDRAIINIIKASGTDPVFTIDESVLWGNSVLFTEEELFDLYQLYNSYNLPMSNYPGSFRLFTKGSETENNDIDLFVYGVEEINDSLDLYMVGFDSVNENLNLFISASESINNQLDLFIYGIDSINDNTDLYIAGKNSESNTIDLFCFSHDSKNQSIDLFINGFDTNTNDIELSIFGKDFQSDNIDLFIYGEGLVSDAVDLIILSKDNINDNINLFINGSLTDTMMISRLYDLFIHGIDTFNDSCDLFVNGEQLLFNNIDYFIHGFQTNTDNINLFIHGIDVLSDFIDTIIFGNLETSSSINLFIHGPEVSTEDLDLYIRVVEASDTDLFIKGISPPVNQSCPALDPTASIQITDDLIEIYQSRIDALINQLGKNVLLEFNPLNLPCPNCIYDPINNRSSGVYKTGGPAQFSRGQKCPYCKSVGFLQEIPTECIKCLIKWNPKEAENYGISVASGKDVVRLKSFLTDGDSLIRAKTAILNYDVQSVIKLRARLIKGPNIVGLRESRYIITFWELIDA